MVKAVEKTIYMCEYCNKEYFKESACRKHENRCQYDYDKDKIIQAMSNEGDHIRMNATSIPKICNMMVESLYRHTGINVDIDIVSTRYSDSVSNQHDCPFNGETNWTKDQNRPLGYRGFIGRIVVSITNTELKKIQEHPTLSKFDTLLGKFISSNDYGGQFFRGIRTGTGSASSKFAQYGIKIFLDDFPAMKKEWKKLKLEAEGENHFEKLIFQRMM